jgi:DNA-binding SARP family transcriptional activator/tetratricopeptide (TPR) repeat protein
VTVRLTGSFTVMHDGAPVFGLGTGSLKARRLLMMLAVHRGQVVGSDRIIDALWDGHPPRRAEQNVATLVSRLRAALGSAAILGARGGYRLGDPPVVRVDVDDAARLVSEASQRLAVGEPAVAVAAGLRALDVLGTGSLLAGEADADWLLTARADAQRLVREARHITASAALLVDDVATAVEVSEGAVVADRFDEAGHRFLMDAHRAAGQPSMALAVYERLRAALADELGVDPAPQTRAVHLAILREQSPPPVPPESGLGRHRPERPGLPGRAEEVARLRDAWAAAIAGDPRLLLVVGEAGVGKTRLAQEAIADADVVGGLVLQARCYAAERSLFLQPFVDAFAAPMAMMRVDRLRELTGARAAAMAGLLPGVDVFGSPQQDRVAPEVELRRAFEGVALMLRGLAVERPVLLVLDDLQNAGQVTVDLLHYLARRAKSSRLLVIANVRAEEGAEWIDALTDVVTQIELGPLPGHAVGQLAAEAGHADLADVIARRTRGHAMFVVETLRGLVAGESGVPETLRAAVLARLRRAGKDVEELLRAGAVLGASVDPVVVGGLLGLPSHVAAHRCEQAAATRLLVVSGRNYEFANDLIQEVLYATTPAPTRLAYHRRAADLLTHQPESVAAHAAAAEDWPRAARAFLLAGQKTADRYATADAETLFTRALEAAERTGQPDLLGRVYVARAHVRGLLTSYRLAEGDTRAGVAAARRAGDRRLEMMALQENGWDTPAALGTPITELAATLRQALGIAESLGDRAVEAALLARLAIISANRLQFDEAVVLGQRAVLAGRASGDSRALASALDGLKTAYAYLGHVQPLSEVLTELEPLQRRLGDLTGLEWAVFESSFVPIAAADWDLARTRIIEAIEINKRSTYIAGQACYVAHLGWLDRLQGRTDLAMRHGERAVALAERTTHRWWYSTAVAMLAGTLQELGRGGEAIPLLTAALPVVRAGIPEAYLLRCLAELAEVTGSRRTVEEGEALLTGIVAPPGSAWLLGMDCYLAVARAWLDAREPQRARTVLAPLLVAAERLGWVPMLAGGLLVDGRAVANLGDHGAAAALLQRAATLAASHDMPSIERDARTHLTGILSR